MSFASEPELTKYTTCPSPPSYAHFHTFVIYLTKYNNPIEVLASKKAQLSFASHTYIQTYNHDAPDLKIARHPLGQSLCVLGYGMVEVNGSSVLQKPGLMHHCINNSGVTVSH
jgi:hypothetical protein